MTDLLPKLLTAGEAAKQLGVCHKTFAKLDIRGVRVGQRLKYTPDDLREFIERNRECPSTERPTHRTGNTTSGIVVTGFTALRKEQKRQKQKRS